MRITGQVVDADSSEGIPGARIAMDGMILAGLDAYATTSDPNGRFEFSVQIRAYGWDLTDKDARELDIIPVYVVRDGYRMYRRHLVYVPLNTSSLRMGAIHLVRAEESAPEPSNTHGEEKGDILPDRSVPLEILGRILDVDSGESIRAATVTIRDTRVPCCGQRWPDVAVTLSDEAGKFGLVPETGAFDVEAFARGEKPPKAFNPTLRSFALVVEKDGYMQYRRFLDKVSDRRPRLNLGSIEMQRESSSDAVTALPW
jgi:hypothetical protein